MRNKLQIFIKNFINILSQVLKVFLDQKENSKALLVGINYLNTKSELKGCVNDVKNVANYLQEQKLYESIEIMTDFTKDNLPTKENILKALRNLCTDAKEGDRIFFHFSGHGTFQQDDNKDEKDGKDECLVTKDMKIITDDELFGIFKILPKNVIVHAVIDCCHSGTMLDLQYTFQNNTWTMQNRNTLQAQVSVISGCMDHQYSLEKYIEGQFQGALTQAFLKEIKLEPKTIELVKNIQDRLDKQYPTLSLSEKILQDKIFFRN